MKDERARKRAEFPQPIYRLLLGLCCRLMPRQHVADASDLAVCTAAHGEPLERLGREQDLDRRTIRKRIKRAIDTLREAEKDLP